MNPETCYILVAQVQLGSGSRKSTSFAAQKIAESLAKKAEEIGLNKCSC